MSTQYPARNKTHTLKMSSSVYFVTYLLHLTRHYSGMNERTHAINGMECYWHTLIFHR